MDTIRSYAERLAVKAGKANDINVINAFQADVLSARAFIIARMNQSLRILPETYISTISCVPLQTASSSECASVPNYNPKLIVKRSTRKIPKPITTLNRESLVSVSNIGIPNIQLPLVTVEESEFLEHKRFTSNAPYCILINDYIYTVNYKDDKFKFRIVAENPIDVFEFNQQIQSDLVTPVEGCTCCASGNNKGCNDNDFSNCISPFGDVLLEKSLGASVMAYLLGGNPK